MSELALNQTRYLPAYFPHFLVISIPLCLALFSQLSGFDIVLAKFIVQIEGGTFLTHNPLLERLLHHGGRYVVAAILCLFMVMLLLASLGIKFRSLNARFWGYLLTSSLCCIVAISALKHFTSLPCPWDTQMFGGVRQYITVFDALLSKYPAAQCYPSGHASGGYAMLSYYFAALQIKQQNQNAISVSALRWLLPGLTLGVIFGVTQQLRGAHFISHDLTTFSLCYAICFLIQRPFFK